MDNIALKLKEIYGANLIINVFLEDGEAEEITTFDLGGALPDDNFNYEIAGFVCPECGELIYFCDFEEELLSSNNGEEIICPICENPLDIN